MNIGKVSLFLVSLIFLIVVVFAYAGSSASYSTRFNEGYTASDNASSASYSQEFILDDYVVGMYDIIDLIASGRFGVLGRNCSWDNGTWGGWGECVSDVQIRIKRDSTGCILAVESQGCGVSDEPEECSDSCSSGDFECGIYVFCGITQNCGGCQEGYECIRGSCEEEKITVETNCTDGIDEDSDGKIDCDDSDCVANLACLCVPDWECSIWDECMFVGGSGVQACSEWVDNNDCDSVEGKPTEEERACVVGLDISYLPQKLSLTTASGQNIDFSVKAGSLVNAEIKIKWYKDGVLTGEKTGTYNVSSSFNRAFFNDSVVKLEVSLGSLKETVQWNVDVDEEIDPLCVEDWECEWGVCNEDWISFSLGCTDINNCGTNIREPTSKVCLCRAEYECGNWSECGADSDVNDVLSRKIIIGGSRHRECIDKIACEKDRVEWQNCTLALPVKMEKTSWCNEEYVEIYEISTNKLVSRIKESSLKGVSGLNIGFIVSDFKGYCSYCYDNVQNFDEVEIDCGGENCPSCVEYRKLINYLIYLQSMLWILLLLLICYFVYSNRKEIKFYFKKYANKNFVSGFLID